MDNVTTLEIVRDALEALLNGVATYAEEHDGRMPVTSEAYLKGCAALRLPWRPDDGRPPQADHH